MYEDKQKMTSTPRPMLRRSRPLRPESMNWALPAVSLLAALASPASAQSVSRLPITPMPPPVAKTGASTVSQLPVTPLLPPAAVKTSAPRVLELPDYGRSTGPEYRMTFSGSASQLQTLAQTHRNACDALGAERCRVASFASEQGSGPSLSARFVLAPGTASSFMEKISKASGTVGFRIDGPPESRIGELKLQQQLLLAQKERLASLKVAPAPDLAALIARKQSGIDAELARNSEQLARMEAPKAESLSVRYDDPERYGRPRHRGKIDFIGSNFTLAAVIVSAVALLTALYFGIVGLAFLALRKFAKRLGWLKE